MIESTLSTVLEGLRSTTDAVGYASPSAEAVVVALRGDDGVADVTGAAFRIVEVGDAIAPPVANDMAVPRPPGDRGAVAAVAPVCSMSVCSGDGAAGSLALLRGTRRCFCDCEMTFKRAVSPFCESTMVVTQLVSGSGGNRTRVMIPGTASLKYRLTKVLIKLDLPTPSVFKQNTL